MKWEASPRQTIHVTMTIEELGCNSAGRRRDDACTQRLHSRPAAGGNLSSICGQNCKIFRPLYPGDGPCQPGRLVLIWMLWSEKASKSKAKELFLPGYGYNFRW